MEIQVKVIGEAKSGKSAVLAQIEHALRMAGLRTRRIGICATDGSMTASSAGAIDGRIPGLRTKVVVLLEEQQLPRAGTPQQPTDANHHAHQWFDRLQEQRAAAFAAAIDFALHYTDDGLLWLREWVEGDVKCMEELDAHCRYIASLRRPPNRMANLKNK
jgi:hypothetical protein